MATTRPDPGRVSQPHLGHSAAPRPHLGQISAKSRPNLGRAPATAQTHLRPHRGSATSRPHLASLRSLLHRRSRELTPPHSLLRSRSREFRLCTHCPVAARESSPPRSFAACESSALHTHCSVAARESSISALTAQWQLVRARLSALAAYQQSVRAHLRTLCSPASATTYRLICGTVEEARPPCPHMGA